MADSECDGWEAIHDRMPPGPGRLRVTATCRVPGDGYECRLERQEPQGINPRDLLLRLVVEGPDYGDGGETDCPVRYEEETDAEYDTVSILPDGPAGIPVQVVL